MKSAAPIAVALISLALAGCATPGGQIVRSGRATLAGGMPTAVRSLVYVRLPLGDLVKAEFDDTSPVIEMSERHSFARGFALPQVSGTLALTVTSCRFGSQTEPAIVYPEIRLLDENFNLVETVAADRFVYRVAAGREGLSADFFVDPAISGARYLLLCERQLTESDYTTAQTNVTSQQQLFVPSRAGFLMWFIPTGYSTLRPICWQRRRDGSS